MCSLHSATCRSAWAKCSRSFTARAPCPNLALPRAAPPALPGSYSWSNHASAPRARDQSHDRDHSYRLRHSVNMSMPAGWWATEQASRTCFVRPASTRPNPRGGQSGRSRHTLSQTIARKQPTFFGRARAERLGAAMTTHPHTFPFPHRRGRRAEIHTSSRRQRWRSSRSGRYGRQIWRWCVRALEQRSAVATPCPYIVAARPGGRCSCCFAQGALTTYRRLSLLDRGRHASAMSLARIHRWMRA